ncbi:hypothetical protein NHF45_01265 [Maricaulaceae bacterium NA33B04]|nr:hypothetical protein [Maricaulaceae bacterium NA33B04]
MIKALLLALLVSTAYGDPVALYQAGEWEAAEQAAVTASDPVSQALAAQAVLAKLMSGEVSALPERERRAFARRAQAHAQAALDMDPDYAPAHLRLAAGLGYEGRYVSPFRAVMARLPQRGREHIERAMDLDPSAPWGPAMLGAWQFEVARRGGEGRLGSSLDAAFTHYRAAVAMEGVEPSIPYHFALALVAKDPVAHREEIDALLAQALSHPSQTAFDQTAKSLAQSLFDLLVADPQAAQAEAITRLER